MGKILCVFHSEETPSLQIYSDGFRCFGCGASGPLSKLPASLVRKEGPPPDKVIENIAASVAQIRDMPRVLTRGLLLPHDGYSYFILWPDGSYYKRRLLGNDRGGDKYRSPLGVTKVPLFIPPDQESPTAIIVEGELNALSISHSTRRHAVCSPGGTGDMSSKAFTAYLPRFQQYRTVLVLADRDSAGAQGAIKLKALLLRYVKDVRIVLMEKDCNDILQEEGKEALAVYIDRRLEV